MSVTDATQLGYFDAQGNATLGPVAELKTYVTALAIAPTALPISTTIPTGHQAVVYGTLTIPVSVTLTIQGTGKLYVTNLVMNSALQP